jgi:hypothetical protein
MKPEQKELIRSVAENLKELSQRAKAIAEFDEGGRLTVLSKDVLKTGELLKRMAKEATRK